VYTLQYKGEGKAYGREGLNILDCKGGGGFGFLGLKWN